MPWPPTPPDKESRLLQRLAAQQKRVDAGRSKPRPKGKAIKRPEQALQIAVADFLRVATIPPARWWFVPNGGHLTKVQRGVFKDMGLTPGVYDLHFAWWQRWDESQGGTWSEHFDDQVMPEFGVIELKAPGKLKDTRESQDDFGADMEAMGHANAVCDSLEGVVETLTAWGFPMRHTDLNPRRV